MSICVLHLVVLSLIIQKRYILSFLFLSFFKLETDKMHEYVHLYTSFGCSINIYTKDVKVYFLFFLSLKFELLGRSHFVSLFTNEEQRKIGS